MMPYKPPFIMTNKLANQAIELAELIGKMSALTPAMKNPRLHREMRIRTIYSTLVIEGNQLDEESVVALLGGKTVQGRAKDILEVKNAEKAYKLLDSLNPHKPDDLLKAHKTLMNGLTKEAGSFRTQNAAVYDENGPVHMGTLAKYVPSVMEDLFDWLTQTTEHPLIASSIFHYEFEFIHPFTDGNGRTGRLWHTLLLSKWNNALTYLPIETVIRSTQNDYYRAFAISESEGSVNPFVEYMLHTIEAAIVENSELIDADKSSRLVEERLLDVLRAQPAITIPELAVNLKTSRRTTERLISALKQSGLIRRKGSSRSGRWEVL